MAEAALRGSIFRMGALAYHLEGAFNHYFSGLTGPSEDVYRSLVAEASALKLAMPTYMECKERLREEVTDFVLEFLGYIYPTLVDAAWLGKWAMMWVIRLIDSIRRELLDHVIVLNERHLTRILASYFSYYHRFRTYRALDMDAPVPRPMYPPALGPVWEVLVFDHSD
jgi:hypothetical protein